MRATLRLALVLPVLVGCASTLPTAAFTAGEQAAFDARVVSVDTAPWAYDGNAVVTVATAASHEVRVQLPARWNLCKAPSIDAQALQPGDRVHVVATANDDGSVTVCERAEHRLARING